jgi:multidrug efflux system membrane fusion protein
MAIDGKAMAWMKRRGLLVSAGVALAVGLILFLLRVGETGHAADAPPPPSAIAVPVTPVVEQTIPVYLEYVGTTDAIRMVTLQAQVTGYLLKPLVADGSDVGAGQLLYQIDPRSYQAALDQAKAQAEKDSAALEYATASHHRNSVMSQNGDVSIDTLQQSASTEHQYDAALAADRAAIETAQLNLSYTDIRAPFAGRLSLSLVHEGAIITTAGTQLNTLVQLDPIYATFNPPDSDLAQIQQYQAKGPIAADVIVGEGTNAQYHGKLTFLDNSVGRSTGTITARATIENPDHSLLPGQFIRVRLHITDQPNTLLVPQVAVNSSQLGQYVFVVGPDNKAEQRFVTLGASFGTLVAVSKGVAKDEPVVVGNLLKIGPGAQVKPAPAAAAPQAAAGGGGG